jgi:hypothetical protein
MTTKPTHDTLGEEKIYINCDRCGLEMQITGDGQARVTKHVVYKNATLCLRCARIRDFDDDNPIMYPNYEK